MLIFYSIISVLLQIYSGTDDSFAESIIYKMDQMYRNQPQEKVFIHFDKPYYQAGENIWFKTYLVDAYDHLPSGTSSIVYVDLINSNEILIEQRRIKMVKGFGHGDFLLPDSLSSGNYIIRAYTNHMLNFDPAFLFRKSIQILPNNSRNDVNSIYPGPGEDKDTINLRFFPEGGDLIEGLLSTVAFKCTDNQGNGINIKGEIIAGSGEIIIDFVSTEFGMGTFKIIPKGKQVYFAKFLYKDSSYKIKLPVAKISGYVMHVINNEDNIELKVFNNMNKAMDGSLLIGHIRGRLYANINPTPGQEFIHAKFRIDKMPKGIACFTFFDSNEIAQCERLVFIDNKENEIETLISTEKDNYSRREKATLKVRVLDHEKKSVPANLSISITNPTLVTPGINQSNISTYLYLESDINEYISNPGYFFNENHPDRNILLDLIMLTNGWRRFTWPELLNDSYDTKVHPYEKGFRIEGQVLKPNKKDPVEGTINLSVLDRRFYYEMVKTDSIGGFVFNHLDLPDTANIIIQANKITEKSKKNRSKSNINDNLHISVKEYQHPKIHTNLFPKLKNDYKTFDIERYTTLFEHIETIDSAYDGRTILLDEVKISGSKIEKDIFFRNRTIMNYSSPDFRLAIDSLPNALISLNVLELINMRIPGVQVIGSPPNVKIRFAGIAYYSDPNPDPDIPAPVEPPGKDLFEPLILIDGMQISTNDVLYFMQGIQVAYIDVLKGSAAAAYGTRGAYGVILVYSRYDSPYDRIESKPGKINILYRGYSQPREFYTPDYSIRAETHIKPDFRTTLFWEPNFITNEENEGELSFYTSDESGQYRVEVQGVSIEGNPVYKEFFFYVN